MLQIGDRVRLRWNGFHQVPRYMEGWEGEVTREPRIRMTKAGPVWMVRVRLPDREERPIRLDQAQKIESTPESTEEVAASVA